MSEELSGIVTGLIAGYYDVETPIGLIRTRARGRFRQQKLKPVVGDQVRLKLQEDQTGYLLEIMPRQNYLGRPALANVSRVLLVVSAVEPDFSLELLDRFLTFFAWKQVAVSLYLSKKDLIETAKLAEIEKKLDYYQQHHYQLFANLEQIKEELADSSQERIWTLAGQSGAGKSTLLNQLLPQASQATSAISQRLNRGRHTTRKVELFKFGNSFLADTPGFSSIDLSPIKLTELEQYFLDFKDLAPQCKFRRCQHLHEPHCAVKEAVGKKILSSRYEHYLAQRQEIETGRMPEYLK
jgi:ribosome biogenesis GTPase